MFWKIIFNGIYPNVKCFLKDKTVFILGERDFAHTTTLLNWRSVHQWSGQLKSDVHMRYTAQTAYHHWNPRVAMVPALCNWRYSRYCGNLCFRQWWLSWHDNDSPFSVYKTWTLLWFAVFCFGSSIVHRGRYFLSYTSDITSLTIAIPSFI